MKPLLLWKAMCVWGHGRVALLIQHETRISHIVCGLSGSTKFLDLTAKTV